MKGIVIATCIAAMLAVWPLTIVRRTQSVASMTEIEYGRTQEYITETVDFKQRFQPQTKRLESIAIAIGSDGQPLEGTLTFELLDEKNEIIVLHSIEANNVTPSVYYEIPVHKWVDSSKTYTYRIVADKDCSAKFFVLYTDGEGTHAPGSVDLYMGEQQVAGQAVTNYSYGYPLNVKNVICIWAFLAVVGVSLCSMIDSLGKKGRAK